MDFPKDDLPKSKVITKKYSGFLRHMTFCCNLKYYTDDTYPLFDI